MQQKVGINDRDFFKQPFSQAEIKELIKDRPAAEMFNFRSPSFSKLGLEKDKLDDDKLIDLMLKEPRLVKRPVVRIDDKVYFGADVSVLKNLVK